ncbi:MAG: GntR family transcriptional regulator [Defluviitaleaceae bacterium]|nr:GntR family transcriptional regulator [Defluviitaleaceae bacterium]
MTNSGEPLYKQICDQLRKDIQTGKFKAGQRLPTEKELCQMYHVSRITSKKALNLLAEENLITRIKGKGSFVYHNQNDANPQPLNDRKIPVIGVIMSVYDNSYGRELLAAIEENCRKKNVLCMFYRSLGDQQVEGKALDDFISYGVDGIIIMPVHGVYYNAKILQLVLNDFPIVVVDRDLKGIPTHFVGTDHLSATEQAMDYLIQAGHRQIGICAPNYKDTSSVEDRIEGAQRSLQKNNIHLDTSLIFTENLDLSPVYSSSESFIKDRQIIMKYLKNNKGMTAAFAINYSTALLIKSAIEELGLSVPDDFNIICFDSPTMEIPGTYFFTHMRQMEDELGKRAFELLCNLMQGELIGRTTKIEIEAKLIVGSSTKPVTHTNK